MEAFLKNLHGKNMALKTQGVTTPPPLGSSRVNNKENNNDCICIAILKATLSRKPLYLSADITVPAMPHTYTIKDLRAGD